MKTLLLTTIVLLLTTISHAQDDGLNNALQYWGNAWGTNYDQYLQDLTLQPAPSLQRQDFYDNHDFNFQTPSRGQNKPQPRCFEDSYGRVYCEGQ